MTLVILHGKLAQAAKRSKWLLSVKTPAEALRAIEANTGSLFSYLRSEEGGNCYYRIVIDGKEVGSSERLALPTVAKSIQFVPVLAGASKAGGIFAIIGFALLFVAIGIMTWGAGLPATGSALAAGKTTMGLGGFMASGMTQAWVAGITFSMGLSLTLSGIASMLAPSPDTTKSPEAKPSYLFSGAVNTMQQGLPVPVGYGELIVGSAVISSGMSAADIPL